MRNLFFCLVASTLLFAGSNAFAQDGAEEVPAEDAETAESSNLLVGITGVVNYSNAAFSEDVPSEFEPDSKLGFGGGLRVIYGFTDMFGVQPEVLFTQRGTSLESDLGGETQEQTTTLNYLQVPLLARVSIPVGGGAITPKVVAGPTFGMFLSGTTEAGDESEDLEDVSAMEIGVAAGAGADFAVGPGSLSLDLRYDRGFTSIDDNDDAEFDTFNTNMSVLIGYNYAL